MKMVKTKYLLALALTVLAALPASANESGPACAMGDYEERWHHRLERVVGGDVIPSMLEECAMMDRIGQSVGSLAKSMFELIMPKPGDMEFLCGFGTDDVFHEISKNTQLKETKSVDSYIDNIGKALEEEIKTGDMPIPGTSRRLSNMKAYERLYGK